MKSTPASVLVIESHPLLRESLCAAINEEADLSVAEPAANNPDAFALRAASLQDVLYLDHEPDIILLALDAPGLEDLQTLRMLRKELPRVPILALINEETPGQKEASLGQGAQAVISKTAGREELLQALRAIKPIRSFTLQQQAG
jgi:DNA-binding NarL/FixJ family response regulator